MLNGVTGFFNCTGKKIRAVTGMYVLTSAPTYAYLIATSSAQTRQSSGSVHTLYVPQAGLRNRLRWPNKRLDEEMRYTRESQRGQLVVEKLARRCCFACELTEHVLCNVQVFLKVFITGFHDFDTRHTTRDEGRGELRRPVVAHSLLSKIV